MGESDIREFLVGFGPDACAYLESRVAYWATKGEAVTISEAAVREVLYSMNRRKALEKDRARHGSGVERTCRHAAKGEVCETCGKVGRRRVEV